MAFPQLHFKSLADISTMIRHGHVTSIDVTQAMFARIRAVDPQINSYAHLCEERAQAQARAADSEIASGITRGALHGVPIAVKDLCYTTYAPTRAGTTIYEGFMAPHNATVVDRLEMAGAVILGKLSMTEGAYTGHHATVPVPLNPWSAAHWVGSSSSGSGAATAAGLCFASLGSDTGGSIRYPCAATGLTGIKPTWGRVSRYGVFALAETLDHIGPMARSAEDCAAILQAIAGWDAHDPTSLDVPVPDYFAALHTGVRDMRIGIDRAYCFDGVDHEVAVALEAALETYDRLGARIVEVQMPPHADLVAQWIRMCAIETALAHVDTYPARTADYGADLAQLIDEGHATTGMQAAAGQQLRMAFTNALSSMMKTVDCMICPTMTKRTPRLSQMDDYGSDPEVLLSIMRYTAPFDFSGSPTITLPNGIDSDGMPLSMQLVGPRLGEAALIRAAAAYQGVTDWHRKQPDID